MFAISYSPPGREVLRLSIAQDLCARCGQMRRREFMALIGNGVVAWPLAARAQQPAKLKPIAMVHPVEKAGNMTITGRRFFRAFFEKLGALGYVEGQNLLVERYSGEGRPDHYAELARDVVSARPDLILALSGALARHFKMATTTIPIVAATSDPIVAGLVPSLAYPGGNITGVSIDAGLEIWGKRSNFSERLCQNCPTPASLYRSHFGKDQKLRQSERPPIRPGFRCQARCWTALLVRQRTNASSCR